MARVGGSFDYEVAIVGGGLAGLTLARQLQRAEDSARILVVERRSHPVPEAAFKVGESTVEVGADYLDRVLDMGDHLTSSHLRKGGLRYFFTRDGNRDIASRLEVGISEFFQAPAYQLDRGRLENWLAGAAQAGGIALADGCAVEDVALDGVAGHRLTLQAGGRRSTVRARWLIDATGRSGWLKRRLGLAQPVGHVVNAVWFRLGAEVDVATWSADGDWLARVRPGLRRLSTNHLMGRGYWVWLIPLASGSTSVGIVADPQVHPFSSFNRFDRALDWLGRYEPQCAAAVAERRGDLQDFRTLRNLAHGCRQLFSGDRWGITGEAGVFTDPLYSSGTDLIAMANGFIADLVRRDLAGESVAARAAQYDELFRAMFHGYLQVYEEQYPVMGHPVAFGAKTIWDMGFYWSWLGLIAQQGRLCDLQFIGRAGPLVASYAALAARTETLFRTWPQRDPPGGRGGFIDVRALGFLNWLNGQFASRFDAADLFQRIADNRALCESLTGVLERCAGAGPPAATVGPGEPDGVPGFSAEARERAAAGAVEFERALLAVGA